MSVTAGAVLIGLIVGAVGLLAVRAAVPNPTGAPRLPVEISAGQRHPHPPSRVHSAEQRVPVTAGSRQ